MTQYPRAAGGRTQPRRIGTMVSHTTMRIGPMNCHRVTRLEDPELQQKRPIPPAIVLHTFTPRQRIGEKFRQIGEIQK